MADTFTKLASSITASTVWTEPYATRIVWITMLAMCDKDGNVYGSIPGLARIAAVTLPECEAALERFQQPDRYSRTKENEGRRVELIDGGWRIINHGKYRASRDPEHRREYMREYMADKRAAGKGGAEVPPKSRPARDEAPPGFEQFWSVYPKKIAKPAAVRAWKAAKIQNGDFEKVMNSVRLNSETFEWRKEAGRYVPNPATWLNQRRWEDQVVFAPEPQSQVPSQFR